jgi:hypothetical protein
MCADCSSTTRTIVCLPDIDHRFNEVITVQSEHPCNANDEVFVQFRAFGQFTGSLLLLTSREHNSFHPAAWALTLAIENVIVESIPSSHQLLLAASAIFCVRQR